MIINEEKITIGVVERETGLSKDLLRTWERRYGFPTPIRSDNDEREYSVADLERLVIIKRLLDNGMRPGKIIALSIEELQAVSTGIGMCDWHQPPGDTDAINTGMNLLLGHNPDALNDFLSGKLITLGLEKFVSEFAAPMNHFVGDAWFRGEINIFHEHCYTSNIEVLLEKAQSFLPARKKPPRILLTTLSGEMHYIGLKMARAIMLIEQADAIFIGSQLPNSEIVAAAEHYSADIVALSFSSYFPVKRAHQSLLLLRSQLDSRFSIWAGGGQICELSPLHPEIRFFSATEEIPSAIAQWRASR